MAKQKQQSNDIEMQILKVNQGRTVISLRGTTPLILNRMSRKAWYELLMPRGRKTAAEKAGNLKHDPIAEYRAAALLDKDPKGPTLLQHVASAFKRAMSNAALDIPGATKSQLGRLAWVVGECIAIYGIPKLFMSVVRSADMNHTPDIRTRVIVPRWACTIEVAFVTPNLNHTSISNLIASAGLTQGIGDWRNQKGSGTYGQYDVVSHDDPAFVEILKTGGRQAQQDALDHPVAYDSETEEMLAWFQVESARRGFKVVS